MDRAIPGIVVGVDGRVSSVRLEDARTLPCDLHGSARQADARSSRVAVGDRVEVVPRDDPPGGTIRTILPRRTKLARGRGREEQVIAANVDQIAIVAAVRDPGWRPGFVDRMICAAHNGGLEPLIIANKIDLLREGEGDAAAVAELAEVRRDLAVFRDLGYRTIETSAATGAGLPALRDALRGRLTVFAGQSGVGKSSLLNAVEPGLRLSTREVSASTGKGRHTTSTTRLLPLAGDGGNPGFVLDTPGVRSFAFYELEEREVGALFIELARVAPSCKYRDCLHLHEPECAVRYAAESGIIDARRYDSYRRVLASLDGEEDPRA